MSNQKDHHGQHMIKNEWRNSDNHKYYSEVSLDTLRDYAVRGGLAEGCDVNLIYPIIETTKSILELGAGYGRVIDHLLHLKYSGKIYAIEVIEKFHEILEQKYDANQVTVIKHDILSMGAIEKIDAAIWMWSGISDFTKIEQIASIKRIHDILTPKGKLIIETFSHELQPANAHSSSNQMYAIPGRKSTIYGYIPSPTEVKKYAEKIGFNVAQHIEYRTDTNRPRNIYILTKTDSAAVKPF